MGMLVFVCPKTGAKISTAVDVDGESYSSLTKNRDRVRCPACSQFHELAAIKSWLSGEASSEPRSIRR